VISVLIFRHSLKPDARIQIDRHDVDLFGTRRELYVGTAFIGGAIPTYIERDVNGRTSYYAELPIRFAAADELGALMYKLVDDLKRLPS